jgi:hypothetical protein
MENEIFLVNITGTGKHNEGELNKEAERLGLNAQETNALFDEKYTCSFSKPTYHFSDGTTLDHWPKHIKCMPAHLNHHLPKCKIPRLANDQSPHRITLPIALLKDF